MTSDLSPSPAKLNYDADNFLVEFNVSEYAPEVRKSTRVELDYVAMQMP